jgi:2'-hydroxyisoflavone reductase
MRDPPHHRGRLHGMKLLILGGTVFLSKTVAVTALTRGHHVTVATRGTSGKPPAGARFVKIDRNDPAGLAGLAGERFDAVVDVARVPGQIAPAIDMWGDQAGHWTFVSTVSVYARHDRPGQTVQTGELLEPSPPDSFDSDMQRYGHNKVACENQVRDRLAGKAFIVRAGLIVGSGDPNDRFGYWPNRIAAGGEILAPGTPQDNVQWIDVRDLAEWIVTAAETRLTGTYDATCPPIPRGEFLARIAEAVNPQARFSWIPQDILAEHAVQPWSGPESLGLWVPLPEYAGHLSRDPSASVTAGMTIRPLADTARDWLASAPEEPQLGAWLSREKEADILAAWHARDRR